MMYNINIIKGTVKHIMTSIKKVKVLNIAIVDDEKALCSELESMLEKIAIQLNIRMEITVWFSGESIHDYLEKGNYLDIIFLDIELIQISGIDVANYIRTDLDNIKTQIVYISSKRNYALKLFKTQPYDFLIKPIEEKVLTNTVVGILKIIEKKNHLFQYQNGREIHQVEYDDILYFKSDKHKVIAVTRTKEIIFYGKLKDIINFVPSQFLLIHKSYLINRDYVTKYTFSFVEMKNHDILTISKVYQKGIRKKLSTREE